MSSSPATDNAEVLRVLREVFPPETGGSTYAMIPAYRFLTPASDYAAGGALKIRWHATEKFSITASDAIARIARAEVVLVGDQHDRDFHRSAFLSLLKEIERHDQRARVSRTETVVALELLPRGFFTSAWRSQSDKTHARRVDQILDAIRLSSSYPVDAYRPIFRWLLARPDVVVYGCDLAAQPEDFQQGVPDRLRRPGDADSLAPEDFAEVVRGTNDRIVSIVMGVLSKRVLGRNKRVIALVGSEHIFSWADSGALLQRFRQRDVRAVVVMPMVREWEIAFREKPGFDEAAWHEVLDDVFVPPYVTGQDILDHGETLRELKRLDDRREDD